VALRLKKITGPVEFPAWTYLSVLMTMHKLEISYQLTDIDWFSEEGYEFKNTNIWDMARSLHPNMYQPGTVQCISFGKTKPVEIGRGGCILTDDKDLATRAMQMRYDGRDLFNFKPWVTQKKFNVGLHYYLRPEDAVVGLNKLKSRDFITQHRDLFNYPDCRTITIE